MVPPWIPRAIAMLLVGFAALFVSYRLFLWLRPLLLILLIALFIALAVEPAVNALARRGVRRGLGTGLVFIALAVASLGFTFTMGQLLVTQVNNISENAPDYIDSTVAWANQRFGLELSPEGITERFTVSEDLISGTAGRFAGSALALAGSAVGVVFNLLSIALFAFFFAAEGPKFRRAVCRLMPARYQRYVLDALTIAIDSTGGYIYSRAALAVVSALVHWVALLVIGVPNAFALALWVGLVSQFVPTLGTYIAGVLPIIVALADAPIDALWVLAFIVVYQQIENYFVAPPLTARTMSLHPAVAFGSVIAGVAIMGPVGALLALPAAASLQAFAANYGRRHDVIDSPLTDTRVGGGSPGAASPAGAESAP
jgi:predicted PurR-regulated permease PerM